MIRCYCVLTVVAMLASAFTSVHAGTNLLVNGGFDVDNGFSEFGGTVPAFDTGFNFAGFQGWPGWASDFDDNGVRDDSYDTGTPGGFMFFNLFPTEPANATSPVLTGPQAGIALGPFDGNTTSFAWQQVAVEPGDTLQVTVWAIVDSTALNSTGQPEPTIFESDENQFFHWVEYVDPTTGDPDIFFDGQAYETIFDAADQTLADFDGLWVESVVETTVPAGASLLRQTLGYNQFNLGVGSVFFDNASVVNLSSGDVLDGDLDYDGVLTGQDVKMMELGVAGALLPASIDRFDLSGNGVIDQPDLDLLIAAIPEPSSLSVCLAALAGSTVLRGRRA